MRVNRQVAQQNDGVSRPLASYFDLRELWQRFLRDLEESLNAFREAGLRVQPPDRRGQILLFAAVFLVLASLFLKPYLPHIWQMLGSP